MMEEPSPTNLEETTRTVGALSSLTEKIPLKNLNDILDRDVRNDVLYLRDTGLVDSEVINGEIHISPVETRRADLEAVAGQGEDYNFGDISQTFYRLEIESPEWEDEEPLLEKRGLCVLGAFGKNISNYGDAVKTKAEIEEYSGIDLGAELDEMVKLGYLDKTWDQQEGKKYWIKRNSVIGNDAQKVYEHIEDTYGGKIFLFDRYYNQKDRMKLEDMGIQFLENT